jgi:hypothetical protein
MPMNAKGVCCGDKNGEVTLSVIDNAYGGLFELNTKSTSSST